MELTEIRSSERHQHNADNFDDGTNNHPTVTVQPSRSAQNEPTTNQAQRTPNCPPGLEYLASIDQLQIKQEIHTLKVVFGCVTQNEYVAKDNLGQNVYWVLEDTNCFFRNCRGSRRAFELKVRNSDQNEVLRFKRRGCLCWSCPCLQELEIFAPQGNLIGMVVQNWAFCTPKFSIKDRNGNTVLKIQGTVCLCPYCADLEFMVLAMDGNQVGKITKQWAGFMQETFTDADNFGINFPMDLDVKVKATLLGALFLIDYMYYERSGNLCFKCSCFSLITTPFRQMPN